MKRPRMGRGRPLVTSGSLGPKTFVNRIFSVKGELQVLVESKVGCLVYKRGYWVWVSYDGRHVHFTGMIPGDRTSVGVWTGGKTGIPLLPTYGCVTLVNVHVSMGTCVCNEPVFNQIP